jgi:predicted nucleotidyltransferase
MITILFGSNIRGDFDKYSDKDVLLIGDHWDRLKEEKISLDEQFRPYFLLILWLFAPPLYLLAGLR